MPSIDELVADLTPERRRLLTLELERDEQRRSDDPTVRDTLYTLEWRPAALPDAPVRSRPLRHSQSGPATALATGPAWLVFTDDVALGRAVAETCTRLGCSCRTLNDSDGAAIAPTLADAAVPEVVLFLQTARRCEPRAALTRDPSLGSGALLELTQALMRDAGCRRRPPRLVVAYDASTAPAALLHAPVVGLARTIALEHPELRTTLLRLNALEADEVAARILLEVNSGDAEADVELGPNRRAVARLVRLHEGAATAEMPSLQTDAAYLVTGGLGGIGLAVARWLAERGAQHIFLLGRRAPNAAAAAMIDCLLQRGTQVRVLQADVTMREQLEAALGTIAASGCPLRGVVHAAGVVDDGVLLQQSANRLHAVLAPKTLGAWNLHVATEAAPLDFFLLFSSIASLFGSAGQGAYAAANAFLDELARYRQERGLAGLSINWGPWQAAGLWANAPAVHRERWRRQGIEPLPERQALATLELAQRTSLPQVLAADLRWDRIAAAQMRAPSVARLCSDFIPSRAEPRATQVSPTALTTPAPTAAALHDRRALVRRLRELAAGVLGREAQSIEVEQPLAEMGFDSLLAIELKSAIAAELGRPLPATLIYDFPTIAAMAAHLLGAGDDDERGDRRRYGGEPGLVAAQSLAGAASGNASEPIAIVGMACRFPGPAVDLEGFWDLLCRGGDVVGLAPGGRWGGEVNRKRTSDGAGQPLELRGSFLSDVERFDAAFFGLSAAEARLLDPQHRLLLEVAWEALERAQQAPDRLAGTSTGLFLGLLLNDYLQLAREANESDFVQTMLGNAHSLAVGRLSYLLGLTGPSVALDTACSSALVAVHLACQSLRERESDLAVAGGVSLLLHPERAIALRMMEALAPDGRCKTFDAAADGFAIGEGCGIVVLRRLGDALAAGEPIVAVIRGSAMNQDGRSSSLTAPHGPAQEAVMREALRRAGITPEAVGLVEAHGTGTILGDPIEIGALAAVFGEHRERREPLYVGSVKTNIGHLEGAAGAAGLIKAALAVQHGRIPAHLHFHTPNPHIPWADLPIAIPTATVPWPAHYSRRIAGVSSFGFSGTNVHLLVEAPPARSGRSRVAAAPITAASAEPPERPLHVLTLSAKSTTALTELCGRYERLLATTKAAFADVCFSANTGRAHLSHRLAVVAPNAESAREALAGLVANAPGHGCFHGIVRHGLRPQLLLGALPAGDDEAVPAPEQIAELRRQAPVFASALHRATEQGVGQPVAKALRELWRSWGIELEDGETTATSCRPNATNAGDSTTLAVLLAPIVAPPRATTSAGAVFIPSIVVTESAWRTLLTGVCRLYVAGAPVDWVGFDAPYERQHLCVPTYPFERQRHWICVPDRDTARPPRPVAGATLDADAARGAEDLRTRVRAVAAEILDCAPEEIAVDTRLMELGADSLHLLGLSRALQESFGLTVAFRQLMSDLGTVDDIAREIERLQPATEEPAQRIPSAAAAAAPTPTTTTTTTTTTTPRLTTTDQQERHVAELNQRLIARTAASKRFVADHRRHFADGRNAAGFRIEAKERCYPVVVDHAREGHFFDLDGNEYVDLAMGFGTLLLGHSPSFVKAALAAEVERGMQLGPQSASAGEVAALISALTGQERIAFCNTGTEAVMVALRCARTVTGRDKVAVFAGSYHGHYDGVLMRPGRATSAGRTSCPGVPTSIARDVLVLPYGEASALDAIEAHAHELAAVLVEPVQSRRPELQPVQFLRELRRLTERLGVPLLFDEVITGFRSHPGGVQALWDVQADLTVYGKAMANGMPVAVIAGRGRIIDAVDGGVWAYGDDSYPSAPQTFLAGTFCKHPFAMAAARAVMRHLQAVGAALQQQLDEKTADLAARLDAVFARRAFPLRVVRFSSLFSFLGLGVTPWLDVFYDHLLEKGVYVWEGRTCFLSTAHTRDDCDHIVAAVAAAVDELQKSGFGTTADTIAPPFGDRPSASRAPLPEDFCVVSQCALTPAQRQLHFVARLGRDGAAAYNQSVVYRFRGALDLARLRDSLQLVMDRHQSLRATFAADGTQQRFREHLVLTAPVVDCNGMSAARLAGAWRDELTRPFDLDADPLVRALIQRQSPTEHALVLTAHHIVADGWSMDAIARELAAIYLQGPAAAREGLPAAVQFSQFAQWLENREGSPMMAQAEEFWRGLFASEVPLLDLPLDHMRPPTYRFGGGSYTCTVPGPLVEALRSLATDHHASLFMVLLAAYKLFLSRLSGQDDIVVPVIAAGQLSAQAPSLVGHCVNILPLRSRIRGTFSDHLMRVKQLVLDANDHQLYPLLRIAEQSRTVRDPSHQPFYGTFFNLDRVEPRVARRVGDLQIEVAPVPAAMTHVDFGLNAALAGEQLSLDFSYNSGLLNGDTVAAWGAAFVQLLMSIVREPRGTMEQLAVVPPRPARAGAGVFDEAGQAVPAGVPGRLWHVTVGADGTESLGPSAELARQHADGAVERLGPVGSRVRLRGLSVSLIEVARVIADVPGVDDAAVRLTDGRLLAYVAPREAAPPADALLARLRRVLPAYMLPASIIYLSAVPRDDQGEVDEARLPRPTPSAAPADVTTAPRSATEALLVKMFAETLGRSSIGIFDDFFAHGGHSLLAMRLMLRLTRELGIELPVVRLFEAPTVAQLAVAVDQAKAMQAPHDVLEPLLDELEQLDEEAVAAELQAVGPECRNKNEK